MIQTYREMTRTQRYHRRKACRYGDLAAGILRHQLLDDLHWVCPPFDDIEELRGFLLLEETIRGWKVPGAFIVGHAEALRAIVGAADGVMARLIAPFQDQLADEVYQLATQAGHHANQVLGGGSWAEDLTDERHPPA